MTISSPGIGSGLDVNSIVSQLVDIEKQPIKLLQTAASGIQTQISAYGKLQSLVSAVGSAASKLAGSTLWKQTSAASSDPTIVAATGTGSAAPGGYEIQVSQLARPQTLASGTYASSKAVVGAGSLTIETGAWSADGGSFTAKAGSSAIALEFTDPNTTLEQVRDRINGAGAGVSASIVVDASGARLALRSTLTGSDNGMRISASDGGGAPLSGGLGGLAYAPDAGIGAMTQTQAAANALLTVNGIALETASNELDGAVEGVNLKLTKTGSTTINVSSDTDAQRKAIDDFVAAYNELNSYLATQTKYDDATKKAGTLQGDSTAVNLRGQLRSLLRESNGASSAFQTLSSIGFDVQKDGSIKIDESRVKAGLAKPAELGKLFANVDAAVPANKGLAGRIRDLADKITGFDGLLTTRSEGLQRRLDRNQSDQDKLNDRIALVQARLMRQYTALDTQLSQLNGLMTSVTKQMDAMAAANKNS